MLLVQADSGPQCWGGSELGIGFVDQIVEPGTGLRHLAGALVEPGTDVALEEQLIVVAEFGEVGSFGQGVSVLEGQVAKIVEKEYPVVGSMHLACVFSLVPSDFIQRRQEQQKIAQVRLRYAVCVTQVN